MTCHLTDAKCRAQVEQICLDKGCLARKAKLSFAGCHGRSCSSSIFNTGCKKMKSCKGLDMNVTDSSVPETQKGIAAVVATPAPAGKTQAGRSVQCEATAIQTLR